MLKIQRRKVLIQAQKLSYLYPSLQRIEKLFKKYQKNTKKNTKIDVTKKDWQLLIFIESQALDKQNHSTFIYWVCSELDWTSLKDLNQEKFDDLDKRSLKINAILFFTVHW